jgi:hypothetical protein
MARFEPQSTIGDLLVTTRDLKLVVRPDQEGIVTIPAVLVGPVPLEEPVGLHDPLLADECPRPLQERVQGGVGGPHVHVTPVEGPQVAPLASGRPGGFGAVYGVPLPSHPLPLHAASLEPEAESRNRLLDPAPLLSVLRPTVLAIFSSPAPYRNA